MLAHFECPKVRRLAQQAYRSKRKSTQFFAFQSAPSCTIWPIKAATINNIRNL